MILRYNLLRQYLTWVVLKESGNKNKWKKSHPVMKQISARDVMYSMVTMCCIFESS